MDTKQEKRLERYLKNASRFLWGLGNGNQWETYQWLFTHGFTNKGDKFKSSYTDTTEKLITQYGIEKIMKDIIIERVKYIYSIGFIDFLRKCWMSGVRPSVDMLKANGFNSLLDNNELEHFLRYNKQFNFIEGWGELAGIWFEEIENL
jgi:hypothetical protein